MIDEDHDYDIVDVYEMTGVPQISTAPLSSDGSHTYLKDLNLALKMLINIVKKDNHLINYCKII